MTAIRSIQKGVLVLVAIVFSGNLWAQQVCTPDPAYTEPGIYPNDPTIKFYTHQDSAKQYELTSVTPLDTAYEFFGIVTDVTVVKVKLDSIVGLPDGFTYTCNPGNCTFDGGASGCILIEGNPTEQDEGTYPVKIYTTITASTILLEADVADTNDYFTLQVLTEEPTLSVVQRNVWAEKITVYPNPFTSLLTVQYSANANEAVKVDIIDMVGRTVLSEQRTVNAGQNTLDLDLDHLPEGFFTIAIDNGSMQYRTKILKGN